MRYLKSFLLSAGFFVALCAQGQPAAFLNLSSDARFYGMGGAVVALDAGAFAPSANPAAAALSEKSFAISAGGLLQSSSIGNSLYGLSTYYKIGEKMAVSFSGKYYSYKTVDNISDSYGNIAGSVKPYEMSADAGFSMVLVDGLSCGLNLRYVRSDLLPGIKDILGGFDDVKAGSAFGVDVGLAYRKNSFSAGVAATNLGSKLDYGASVAQLPADVKAGAAYRLGPEESHSFTLSVQGDFLIRTGGFMAGAGAEYSFKDMIFARAGFHYGDAEKTIPSYASVGAGVRFYGINVDAAYLLAVGNSPLGNSLSMSLGWSF